MINRRTAIRQVMILAGGMALVPSLLKASGGPSIALRNLVLSGKEENLMASVAEIIIPKTQTPGARDLNLHLFVMKMVDDCYDEGSQQRFLRGLKVFSGLDAAALKELVVSVNSGKAVADEDAKYFYRVMKQQTINGYMNSKYVMTNLIVWELVPARYNGYFPVKS